MEKKILIHTCCGPCAIIPIKMLEGEFEPIGFWFNPNIHPYKEYQKRLQTAGYVFKRLNREIFWDISYDIFSWFSLIIEEIKNGRDRCEKCYAIRLEKTAQFAKQNGFKYFTTSMLVSPYQKTSSIERIGKETGEKYSLIFISRDFKSHYKEEKVFIKQWQLYHQNYCGCLFSEIERLGIVNEKI
jgi:predicted adenine nucleotide alpha hydrolase (AANH) superfamily ATPase